MDMAKQHGVDIDAVVVEPMPEMEESATFSDLGDSKDSLMDSSSKRRKNRPKRRPSFGGSFGRRPSIGASFPRRPSFGNLSAMLDLSGSNNGLSATQHTQNETNSDDSPSSPPMSEEERRKKRKERRRRSNRPSSGTTGAAEKPRRRSRSNTRLDTNTFSEKELLETGAFLETLMATPAGQAKLKAVIADKNVMQRISLAY